MTKVFLTGDRSLPEPLALLAAASAVAQLNLKAITEGDELEIGTGDNVGFEQGVREFLEHLHVPFTTVPTGVDPDTEKPAWDTRHEVVNAGFDKVYLLHGDPLSSSIGASAMKVLGDKVELVSI